ncbi:unnamed protein product [Ectocarpus fasciculatus]
MSSARPQTPASEGSGDDFSAPLLLPRRESTHRGRSSVRRPVETRRLPDKSRSWWFLLAMGVLLFVTAGTQAWLASTIRRKARTCRLQQRTGIEILDESYYMAAGDPVVGFLAYGVGACSVMVTLMAEAGQGVEIATWTMIVWAVITVVISVTRSFDQIAVYGCLDDYDYCVENFIDLRYSYGDCLCGKGHSVDLHVDIAQNVDFVCDDIMDTVDDMLASYVLTWFILVEIVVTVVLQARRWLPCWRHHCPQRIR